jgi:hypothetical protein
MTKIRGIHKLSIDFESILADIPNFGNIAQRCAAVGGAYSEPWQGLIR